MTDALAQFETAMRARALLIPGAGIKADGKLHRCDAKGPHGHGDGAYLLHLDGVPAGGIQNHRDGLGWQNWRADSDRRLSQAEDAAHKARIAAMRAVQDEDLARRHQAAAKLAATVWRASGDASGHAYLMSKGIGSHGAGMISSRRLAELGGRVELSGALLVVPVRGADRQLQGLQFIDGAGEKRFLLGTKTASGYFAIGGKPDETISVAEGFATAASVHEATGWRVAAALSKDNLRPVAEALRAKLPSVRLVICGDSDADGGGQAKAREAAQAVGGLVALPATHKDWNDALVARGAEAVRLEIEAALAAPVEAAAPADGVVIQRADSIKVEPIRWLWNGWLALGKLHLLAGAPGCGKTTLALAFAATLSRGGLWPDGTRAPTGSTLIWSSEDDAGDSIKPRFLANGGDPEKLHIVSGRMEGGKRVPFDPAVDMPALAEEAKQFPDLRLLILDPILSAVGGDSHKASETRRSLQPVVDMAQGAGAAALGITHFGKNTAGRDASERVIGSQAFVALARLVMLAAKPRENGEPRRLMRAKSNIGPDDGGFEYDLELVPLADVPSIHGQRVTFGAALEGTARELLAEIEGSDGGEREAPARTNAEEWLRRTLADGPVASDEVNRHAKAEGLSWATVRRAKAELGIKPRRMAGAGAGGWWAWELPKVLTDSKDAHSNTVSPLGENEHLRPTGSDREVF